MVKTLPQCGRGPNGASRCSSSATTGATAAASSIQVKWMASESCWYAGLSHRSSAATVRSSETCSTAATRVADRLHGVQRGDRVPRAARGTRSAARPRCSACGRAGSAAAARATARARRAARCSWPATCRAPGAVVRSAARAPSQSGSECGARVVGPPLHPDLVDDVPAPGGEQADAGAGGEDLVEVGGQPPDREVLVDGLRHVVRRLDRQRDGGDHTERAQRDDRAGEPRVGAVEPQHSPGRGDQVEADHGGRQAAQGRAGAVGPGRAPRRRPRCAAASRGCAAPGRAPAAPPPPRRSASPRRRSPCVRSADTSTVRQAGHRDQVAGGVRDGGERVPAAQRAHPVAGGHQRTGARRGSPAGAPGRRRR